MVFTANVKKVLTDADKRRILPSVRQIPPGAWRRHPLRPFFGGEGSTMDTVLGNVQHLGGFTPGEYAKMAEGLMGRQPPKDIIGRLKDEIARLDAEEKRVHQRRCDLGRLLERLEGDGDLKELAELVRGL
jgi:hypothetical protein